jgi:uncharacterized protein
MKRALFAIGFCIVASVALAPIAAAKGWHHAHRDQLLLPSAAPSVATGPVINATPAMWTVHGPKGTAYLLGSIHVLPKNVNWQTPEITAAMKRADTFVFEIPLDEEHMTALTALYVQKGLMPLSRSLPSLFDTEMRSEWRHVIDLTHADASLIVYMRPWLASLVLQGSIDPSGKDFSGKNGVDRKVYEFAQERGVKNFRAFETNEFQMGVLMGMGHSDAINEMAGLKTTFKEILSEGGDRTTLHDMFGAWARGDTKKLISYGPEDKAMSPDMQKSFLENRNRSWIPQIAGMLNEKHVYFITVGALHLVGATGVPNLLRAEGYKVDGP